MKMLEKIAISLENIQQNILSSTQFQQGNWQTLWTLKDLILQQQTIDLQKQHPNPLNRFGNKCFSQTDEDGITLEIVRRLNLEKGVYAEFGVGNGLENNTLILASIGWRGFWVGGEDLAFRYEGATRFKYIKDWITLENIVSHARDGLNQIGSASIDVLSLDLDGNDIYFVEEILANGISPKLFIVEYNAKFPPPAKFQIDYNAEHRWMGDDYFGAALTNFAEMFAKYNFKLVCCNSHSGGNAFFINGAHKHLFNDVPDDMRDIHVAPRYHLYTRYGHSISAKVVEKIINQSD